MTKTFSLQPETPVTFDSQHCLYEAKARVKTEEKRDARVKLYGLFLLFA